MLLGARQFFEKRGGGWKNPYVADGLVAMWDGEWNAGGGVHDAAATVWKDVSGNGYDLPLSAASVSLGENTMTINSGSVLDYGESVEIACLEFVGSIRKTSAFFIGKIINTGHAYGLAMRYKWASFNPTTSNQLSSDSLLPLASYSMSAGSIYKNSESVAVSAANYPADIGSLGIVAGDTNTLNINSIRLYNSALTAAEVAANYSIDKARFNLP